MTFELQQLESAIQALDAQRALLGDAVTETALAPLRAQRDALLAAPGVRGETTPVVVRRPSPPPSRVRERVGVRAVACPPKVLFLMSLGVIASVLGDFALSEVHHRQALALALGRQAGWRLAEATAHINIGQCVLERGDIAAALVWADEAFELARQIEERTIMARSFLLRADACEAARDPPAALAALEEARTRFEAVDAAPHVAITSVLIAEHCRLADDLSRAVAEVNRVLLALAGGVSLDGTGEELRVRHLCVKVLQATGDARAALQLEALHADLQATVARIADAATRLASLDNVQAHREIVAAWAARSVPG